MTSTGNGEVSQVLSELGYKPNIYGEHWKSSTRLQLHDARGFLEHYKKHFEKSPEYLEHPETRITADPESDSSKLAKTLRDEIINIKAELSKKFKTHSFRIVEGFDKNGLPVDRLETI